MPSEPFLRVYNCEYIRPPRPERFMRARKQIYRPAYVWSHFVHYSTVNADVARTFDQHPSGRGYDRKIRHEPHEVYLDELNEGMLVHARSVLPHETRYLQQSCFTKSKYTCSVGYVCPDSTPFLDKTHKDNTFVDEKGNYCNCWPNHKIENVYVPQLRTALETMMESGEDHANGDGVGNEENEEER